MSFFDAMRQRQTGHGQSGMQAELGNIKADPSGYLKDRGFTIPDGMTDPKAITQHLLQTGQIGNGKLQQVLRMIGMR